MSDALSPADLARLRDNLARVRERIASASARAGRDPAGVRLVAVTKYAGAPFARGLLALGQRDLGESRVDHLLALARALAGAEPAPRWHLVGHLQRNKAARVADLLDVLHSLDSLELAERLAARRSPARPPLACFVEVRLDEGAEARSGIEAAALPAFVASLAGLTRLSPLGLMGLPPLGPPEAARACFRRLRALASGVAGLGRELSMGMSADLEVAIEEGATCVRIGQALLEGLSEEARRA